MEEEVLAVCRAWILGKGDYALFLTHERLVAGQVGTLVGTLAYGFLGGPLGLVLSDLKQAKNFRQLRDAITAKALDLNGLANASPKNVSVSYTDIETAIIYKKLGNAPLVIKTKSDKISFSLYSGEDYKLAKEVLQRTLGQRFKAKGFWSSLTKM